MEGGREERRINVFVAYSSSHFTSHTLSGTYLPVMEPPPYLPGSQPTSEPNSPPPEGDGLKGTLVRQLEYYFSKENLSSDKYLREFEVFCSLLSSPHSSTLSCSFTNGWTPLCLRLSYSKFL